MDTLLSASLGVGILVAAGAVVVGIVLGFENRAMQIGLLVFYLASTGSALCLPDYRRIIRAATPLLTAFFLYYHLANAFVAFPELNFRDVSARQTMELVRLEADNYIPYNFSRYVVERVDPNSKDVVPTWKAGDRPPLVALLNSGLFITLGIEDGGPWMETRPGVFFVFQCLGTFLNALAILSVWQTGKYLFGTQAAWLSVLLAASSYFFFVNTFFTWPKLLMAFLLITGTLVFLQGAGQRRNLLLAGLLFGASLLAHEMAAFTLCALFIFLAAQSGRNFKRLIELTYVLIGAAFVTVPWLLYKSLYLEPAYRGFAYHVLCYNRPLAEGKLRVVVSQFLNDWTLPTYLQRVGSNIIRPFRLPEHLSLWNRPLEYFNHSQPDAFFGLASGLGWPIFLLALAGCLFTFRSRTVGAGAMLITAFGALIVNALTAGCANSTVNHVWAYPAFVILPVSAGAVVARGSSLALLFAGLGLGLNITQAILVLWYQSPQQVFLNASGSYTLTLIFLWIAFLGLTLWSAWKARQTEASLREGVAI